MKMAVPAVILLALACGPVGQDPPGGKPSAGGRERKADASACRTLVVHLFGMDAKEKKVLERLRRKELGDHRWVYACGEYFAPEGLSRALVGVRGAVRGKSGPPPRLVFSLRVHCRLTDPMVVETVRVLLAVGPARVEIVRQGKSR